MEVDHTTAARDLKNLVDGLHVVEIAQTPIGEAKSAFIRDSKTDVFTNPLLRSAMAIYSKHYLASHEGIEGEGEEPDVILKRLRGDVPDDPCKAITVYGLADKDQKIHGVAFVETYPIHEKQADGTTLEGLNHLMTYAAAEPGYHSYLSNAAFHAGIVHKLREMDIKFHSVGHSILTTEVNASVNYEGKRTSPKMDVEFEIKTGAPREYRQAYLLGGSPDIIGLEGPYNNAHILQIAYPPPALAGEGSESLADIKTARELAPHLKNLDAFNGIGEPLFLTAETLDGTPLSEHHLALQRAFQKQLLVSVMRDRGVTDTGLILEARNMREAGFGGMDMGYGSLGRILRPLHYSGPRPDQAPRLL
jgi:hypothetical protein